jgi:predicted ArsR family transcriptional regulator
VYGEIVSQEKFNFIFDTAIREEYERHRILLSLDKDSKSVKDLAIELKIDPSIVLEHMLVLKTRSQVDFQKIIVNTPIFMRINI